MTGSGHGIRIELEAKARLDATRIFRTGESADDGAGEGGVGGGAEAGVFFIGGKSPGTVFANYGADGRAEEFGGDPGERLGSVPVGPGGRDSGGGRREGRGRRGLVAGFEEQFLASNFRRLYCEKRCCPDADYGERALRECLYWRASVMRRLLVAVWPEFFARDRRFIENLGRTRGLRDAVAEVKTFDDVNRGPEAGLREWLGLRVSGRKALRLARELAKGERGEEEVAASTGVGR